MRTQCAGGGSRAGGRGLMVVIALVLVLTGCGLPRDGTTRTIERGDVPYRLLDAPGGATSSTSTSGPAVRAPHVFFVNRDGLLVPHAQPVNVSDLKAVLAALLTALAAGPPQVQRQRGLATALGPDVTLELIGVRERVARIRIVPGARPPDAERLPLAVGQVVLTATSVEGVDKVVIVQDADPLELPLPGGERTSDPVTAQDYARLLADAAGSATKVKPEND